MSTLHLVRIPLDLRALVAFALAGGVDDDDRGYATHLALRRRFGAAAPQPFRLFGAEAAAPYLLGYATDVPALLDAAALPCLDPRLEAVFPEVPAVRPMPATWRPGARYGFEVRARPVVRYGTRARGTRMAEGRRGAAERDAFLAALEKAGGEPVSREVVYAEWLARQIGGAAVLEHVAIKAMRRLSTRRSPHGRPGPARIEGYEALFAGTLTVGGTEAFARLLRRG